MDVNVIQECGQSIWLDDIRHHLLQSGEFGRWVLDDGIRGATAHSSILKCAVATSTDYESVLERDKGARETASEAYERAALEDVQWAADILHPVYVEFARRDRYVSMEVSPHLAYDTQGTIDAATRLWNTIHRDNLMIAVPATPEGIAAIRVLVGNGINVNVTLLFSRAGCRRAAEAYMNGLETFSVRGGDLSRVASVASMFVSRLDVLVDSTLKVRLGTATPAEQVQLQGVVGKVAIATAKVAYQDWKEVCGAPRWAALAASGAHPQRLLWPSTSAGDARLRDVVFVEELIGPETIQTIAPATLKALQDDGAVKNGLEDNVDDARRQLVAIERAGILIDDLAQHLLDDGIKTCSASFDAIMRAVKTKRSGGPNRAGDGLGKSLPQEDEAPP